MGHGKRARIYVALIACLLWLAGVEAMPAMHEAMHARLGAHRHEGALIIPIDDRGRDAGPAIADEDAADSDDPVPRHHYSDAERHLARALGHGRGSLAHRDQALHAPAIALHAPLPIDRRPRSLADVSVATPASAVVPVAAARGPPARRLAA